MKQRICIDEYSFIHPNFGSASAINPIRAQTKIIIHGLIISKTVRSLVRTFSEIKLVL